MWRSPYPREDWEDKRRYSPHSSLEDDESSNRSTVQSPAINTDPSELLDSKESLEIDTVSSSTLPDLVIERVDRHTGLNVNKSSDSELSAFTNLKDEDKEIGSERFKPLDGDKTEPVLDETDSVNETTLNDSNDPAADPYDACDEEDKEERQLNDHDRNEDTESKEFIGQLSTIQEVTEVDNEDNETEKLSSSPVSRTFTEQSYHSFILTRSVKALTDFPVENAKENISKSTENDSINDHACGDKTRESTNQDLDEKMDEIEVIRRVESSGRNADHSIHITNDEEAESNASLPVHIERRRSFSLPQSLEDHERVNRKRSRDSSESHDPSLHPLKYSKSEIMGIDNGIDMGTQTSRIGMKRSQGTQTTQVGITQNKSTQFVSSERNNTRNQGTQIGGGIIRRNQSTQTDGVNTNHGTGESKVIFAGHTQISNSRVVIN